MARYNRRNSLSKTFKDYLVPIIGLVLIIILIFSFFSGKKETPQITQEENRTAISVNLNGEGNESYVVYPGGNKEAFTTATKLYKGEKLVVKTGTASAEIPEVGTVELNKIGEMKFDEDGGLSLYSSDMWVNLDAAQKVNMRYGTVFAKENAVFSITQNEVGSTVYMMSGVADVNNLGGKSVVLGKGQKITISREDAAKDDIDLSILRDDLDDYFKASEWYIKNNGDFHLNNTEETGSGTIDEETSTGALLMKKSLFEMLSPKDESTVNTETIIIEGKIHSDEVATIEINGEEATINTEENTFEISEYTLSTTENNLIIKAYDEGDNLIEKSLTTVYKAGAQTAAKFEVQNFSLDASKFTFIKPTVNPYTTTKDLVTIQGYVPPGVVSKITVNGFQLGSLTPYGSYWRYHANAEFGNLKEGLNVYKVIYFGKESEVLHSNAFTIIKKAPIIEEVVETKVISDEAL